MICDNLIQELVLNVDLKLLKMTTVIKFNATHAELGLTIVVVVFGILQMLMVGITIGLIASITKEIMRKLM